VENVIFHSCSGRRNVRNKNGEITDSFNFLTIHKDVESVAESWLCITEQEFANNLSSIQISALSTCFGQNFSISENFYKWASWQCSFPMIVFELRWRFMEWSKFASVTRYNEFQGQLDLIALADAIAGHRISPEAFLTDGSVTPNHRVSWGWFSSTWLVTPKTYSMRDLQHSDSIYRLSRK
jgi:hypothetical protein